MRKHRELLVAKIDFGVDKTLLKELGNLSQHQISNLVLMKFREQLKNYTIEYKDRYMIRIHVLLCKNDRKHPCCMAMLLSNLEYWLIKYVQALLGHEGTDKCVHHISQSFHLKNLGRKMRSNVAHCDICQRVKHRNRAFEIVSQSHLPAKPGELLTLDLSRPFPAGRGGVKSLLVCLMFFLNMSSCIL
jgi:hypothetical protein